MKKLNEESIRIVQENHKSYKEMLERSQRDHEIQERRNQKIFEDKIKDFQKALKIFLTGAACVAILLGVNEFRTELDKGLKFQTYYDAGEDIIQENTYRVNPTQSGIAYHNDKIAKDILKNEESRHEEKKEDDTKYLIAGVSKAMRYNMNKNMDEVISHMNNEDFKNWQEYLDYLGYDSYDDYIAGIKDELGVKNKGGR